MTNTETAYAKVNLALHVRRRRDDGYHDLETVFAFADFGDVLTAAPARTIRLGVTGPFADGLGSDCNNLVVRAAEALQEHYGISAGADLHLEKFLPVASGIGGGSADAAATLRLLNRVWEIGADDGALASIGASLGADVPACVASRTSRGEGIGDHLVELEAGELTGRPIVLVNPMRPVSTAAVFKAWNGEDRGALADLLPLAAAIAGRNDLEAPAIAICPEIASVLDALSGEGGADVVRMSGSGATCFALYEDEADAREAVRAITFANPGWWVAGGKLR